MASSALFFAFLLLILTVTSFTEAQRPHGAENVGYQIHSFNDLREWPSVLLKGAKYLKVDFYYETPDFCKSQGVSNPNGCFILIHDKPIPTVVLNSSNDLLNFLANSSYASYFKDPSNPISIALCFKESPADICGKPGEPFLRLLDDFYGKAQQLLSNGYHVEFILDGSLSPTESCTINRYQKWPATWQGLPIEAFFSDNNTHGYDRYAIFDLPAFTPLIAQASALHWGKFSRGKHPLLIWEPEDEKYIASFSTIYLNWASKLPRTAYIPDYRFAINIDPVQFDIYKTTTTKIGWRDLFVSQNAEKPFVEILPSLHDKNRLSFISLFHFNDSVWSTIQFTEDWMGNRLVAQPTIELPYPEGYKVLSVSSVDATRLAGSPTTLVVLSSSTVPNSFILLPYNREMHQLRPLNTQQLLQAPLKVISKVSTFTKPSPTSPNSFLLMLEATAIAGPSEDCSLMLSATKIVSIQPEMRFVEVGSVCVTHSKFVDIPSLSIAASWTLDSSTNTSLGILTYSSQGIVYGFPIHLVNYPDDGWEFVISNRISLPFSSVNQPLHPLQVLPKAITVGNSVRASVAMESNGRLMLHVVQSDGYCFNTEDRNKQPAPICDTTPVSTSLVLTYSYGPLDHWFKYLADLKSKMLSVCSSDILHGSYDQGRNPSMSIALFKGRIGVIEQHEGWRPTDKDVTKCGAPLIMAPEGGVVINSWKLANPKW